MGTQLITIDSAACISFQGSETVAEPPHAGSLDEGNRLSDRDFFRGKSLAELAREQGVGPVKDIRVFAGVIPDDEDVDEMLAQIEAMRGSTPDPDDAIRARLADVDRQEEKRRRLQAFLERETPAWNPDDHPEIDAAGGAAAWVRKLRREAEQGFRRRTGQQENE
jgi:hypothetical protein